MKDLATFLPDILPDMPGCGPDMALQALRNTVTEFCEKSQIHQVTLEPVTLLPGVLEYDIEPPTGYRVAKIMKVWFRGVVLEPLAPDAINQPEAFADFVGGYVAPTSTPVGYLQRTRDTVTFLPIPDQKYANAVTIRGALAPLRDHTSVEDFLYEEWGEVIAAGAKARLMLNPGKPYSNTEAASVNQARYISGRNEALQQARRGGVRSGLRVQLRKI